MIGAAQAWKILGIAPTSERREIRRAYATKLKVIDPDADIAGFQRLRDALAMAERLARSMPKSGEASEPPISPLGPAPVSGQTNISLAFGAPVLDPPPRRRKSRSAPQVDRENTELPPAAPVVSPTAPSPPPAVDPMVERRRRFVNMLNRRGSSGRGADELVALFESMLADERMDQVGFADEFETWLAQQLMQAIPRSDPVIPLAVERFGWQKELQGIRQRYAPAQVARRSDDLRCIAALSKPEHKWHDVFMLLQEPAPAKLELTKRLKHGMKVAELLGSLRYHNQDVERLLDPVHVALWHRTVENAGSSQSKLFKSEGISWFGWLMIGWLVLSILRFAIPSASIDPQDRADEPALQSKLVPAPLTQSSPTINAFKPAEAVPQIQECMNSSGLPRFGLDTWHCDRSGRQEPKAALASIPQRPPTFQATGTEKLPRNIQECVNAGGNLRITPDKYICERTVKPDQQNPAKAIPVVRAPEPSAPPLAPYPSARARQPFQEISDCIDAGGKPHIGPADVKCVKPFTSAAPLP